MADDIEELVVKARPEGLDETSEGFQQMEEDLDAAEQGMADTTGQLAEMSSEWVGLMGTLVTGLAVASAGLLSQVPVVGEAFSALGSIVDGVAYRMDSVLRPVLQPITNGLYTLAGAIFNAEGAAGTAIGVFGSVISILGILAGVVGSAIAGFLALGGSWATVTAAAGTLASAITGVAATLAGLISLPAVVAAAFAAGIAIILTDFMGLRTKAVSILSGLWMDAKTIFGNLVSEGVSSGKDIYDGITGWLSSIWEVAKNTFNSLVSKAKEWGTNLISNLIQGIQNMIPDLSGILNQDIVAGVSINDVIGAVDGAISGGGGGGNGGSGGFRASRNTSVAVNIDGRTAWRGTKKYSTSGTDRRGRYG